MKAYRGGEVYVHAWLARGELSASRPGRSIPWEKDAAGHGIGGPVGPRAGLNDVEKRNSNFDPYVVQPVAVQVVPEHYNQFRMNMSVV
jgi:hypothetical protein